jgi:predicted DNA-binding protein (MmcQ/YjbR family)
MELKNLRRYLLQKRGSTEETPFGSQALVYKIMGKMFALIAWEESPLRITLKCEPDLALTLRQQYQAIQSGYHMSKKHWNSIWLDGTIPDEKILGLVDHSYELVLGSLKKIDREKLQVMLERTR